ncbi:MAG: hypothetical protein AABX03_05170 [Nanoarchaeota archaeon]
MVGHANTHRVYRTDEVESILRDYSRVIQVANSRIPSGRPRIDDLVWAWCSAERVPERFRDSEYNTYVRKINEEINLIKDQEAENQRVAEEGLIPVCVGFGRAMNTLYGNSNPKLL